MKLARILFVMILAAMFCVLGPARAEEFNCEVLEVSGTVTLSNARVSGKPLNEGDILSVDDTVEVAENSYVDIAYDSDWNNVTRIEEGTKIKISALFPTTINLEKGGVYAKLKKLPKESTFDVQTPTAIASVRGTEYRTTYLGGETEIFNVSDSDVFVYGFNASGGKQSEPVVLKNSQKTQIQNIGAPIAARPMQANDFKPVQQARERIEGKIRQNMAQGRMGKIQNVEKVEQVHREGGHRGQGGERSGQVRTMSAEEAHQAVKNITHGNGDEQPGTMGESTRENRRPEGERGEMGRMNERDKGDREDSGPRNDRSGFNQGNGMRFGERRADANGGQPFGPDPGRRPSDSDFRKPGQPEGQHGQGQNGPNHKQGQGQGRPAPRGGNRR